MSSWVIYPKPVRLVELAKNLTSFCRAGNKRSGCRQPLKMDSIIGTSNANAQVLNDNQFFLRLIIDTTINSRTYNGSFSYVPNAIFVTAFGIDGEDLSLSGVLMSPSSTNTLGGSSGGMNSAEIAFRWSSSLAYYCGVGGSTGSMPRSLHITIFEICQ